MLRLVAFGVCAVALSSIPALAQDRPFAVGGQVGTPGVGVNVQYALNDWVVLRGSYDRLTWDVDDTYDGIDYNGELDFSSPGAFVDLHPTGGSFFVTAGAYFGDRGINIDATPTGPVAVGSQTFTPAQVGTLTGVIETADVAPVVGLGFDNTFTSDRRWGFRFMAGAAFSDEPNVVLSSTGGTLSNDPTFQQRLAEEELEIEGEADDFKILPVVQVGLAYRF